MSAYPPLPCDKIVFRAILYPEWKDKKTGLPKWQNFKRRRADFHGISLAFSEARCTRELDDHHGIMTVHIGRVRDVSTIDDPIDVVQDEREHSNIKGLPLPLRRRWREDS